MSSVDMNSISHSHTIVEIFQQTSMLLLTGQTIWNYILVFCWTNSLAALLTFLSALQSFQLVTSAGLTTRLTRLQPRAPDFLGAPKRPHPRKGLNEFRLMYEIREIIKIVLVQFYQIYLISLFKYIGISVTNSNCSCCRLHLSISYISLCSDSVIPVEKILNSFRTKRWVRNSRTRTPCYETVNGWAPFLLFQQVGPLLYYFNGWGPFFIISTRWGPFFIISTSGPFLFMGGAFFISTGAWGPFFIISTGGAPSLLFQGMHWALLICSHLSLATDSH